MTQHTFYPATETTICDECHMHFAAYQVETRDDAGDLWHSYLCQHCADELRPADSDGQQVAKQ